jgi:hypothetical protein
MLPTSNAKTCSVMGATDTGAANKPIRNRNGIHTNSTSIDMFGLNVPCSMEPVNCNPIHKNELTNTRGIAGLTRLYRTKTKEKGNTRRSIKRQNRTLSLKI